jgi:hypothetical protein
VEKENPRNPRNLKNPKQRKTDPVKYVYKYK